MGLANLDLNELLGTPSRPEADPGSLYAQEQVLEPVPDIVQPPEETTDNLRP